MTFQQRSKVKDRLRLDTKATNKQKEVSSLPYLKVENWLGMCTNSKSTKAGQPLTGLSLCCVESSRLCLFTSISNLVSPYKRSSLLQEQQQSKVAQALHFNRPKCKRSTLLWTGKKGTTQIKFDLLNDSLQKSISCQRSTSMLLAPLLLIKWKRSVWLLKPIVIAKLLRFRTKIQISTTLNMPSTSRSKEMIITKRWSLSSKKRGKGGDRLLSLRDAADWNRLTKSFQTFRM